MNFKISDSIHPSNRIECNSYKYSFLFRKNNISMGPPSPSYMPGYSVLVVLLCISTPSVARPMGCDHLKLTITFWGYWQRIKPIPCSLHTMYINDACNNKLYKYLNPMGWGQTDHYNVSGVFLYTSAPCGARLMGCDHMKLTNFQGVLTVYKTYT